MLNARDRALETRLARMAEQRARSGGERWAMPVTAELTRRDEAERAWIAELRVLAAEQ